MRVPIPLGTKTFLAAVLIVLAQSMPGACGDKPEAAKMVLESTPVLGSPSYVCGDANGDGLVQVGDAIFILNYLFKEGGAPDPICVGDASGDGAINLADVVWLLNYLFRNDDPPNGNCCDVAG
jgi:hypothetical protein